jgi:tetratricopeptide (TPR) repeat protein
MRLVDSGLEAFLRRDYGNAAAIFSSGRFQTPNPAIFELGEIYVKIAEGRGAETLPRLQKLVSVAPGYVAAVETTGDVLALLKRERAALEMYRTLLRLVPGDSRALHQIPLMKGLLVERTRQTATESLKSGDLEGARKAGMALVSLDSKSPTGYEILARVAQASERYEDAYTWAQQASNRGSMSAGWQDLVADMALKTGRFAEAVAIYDALAKKDVAYKEKADTARLEFRIQNLPEAAQRAALSPRLTRAQLAALLWATVAEVRQTPVSGQSRIATDTVDHPERQAIVRAIGLGILTVPESTHRVGVDVPVSRQELGNVLRRLAALAAAGRKLTGCLSTEPASLQALDSCGILPLSSVRTVTGREGIRAIERTVRFAREGYTR